jgi:hypothetical protein
VKVKPGLTMSERAQVKGMGEYISEGSVEVSKPERELDDVFGPPVHLMAVWFVGDIGLGGVGSLGRFIDQGLSLVRPCTASQG